MIDTLIHRLLREPLLHFFVIGAVIFAAYAATTGTPQHKTDVITITSVRTDQITASFQSVWKRRPTTDELQALIEEDIREEVYYRDALALGLDNNDAVVRRRLRQKMEFLTDTGSYLKEPSSAELKAYFDANIKHYQRRPRLTFEQIYLGQTPTKERVQRSLQAIGSNPSIDASRLTQHTLLPARLTSSRPSAIDGAFGHGFFDRIAKLPPGKWQGPVRSNYGVHLVKIEDHTPARTPNFDNVRDNILRDWRAEKSKQHRENDYAERRKKYVVEIEPHNEPSVVSR